MQRSLRRWRAFARMHFGLEPCRNRQHAKTERVDCAHTDLSCFLCCPAQDDDVADAERRHSLVSHGAAAAPLPLPLVARLVDALWEKVPLLGDFAWLVSQLQDQALAQARGDLATAHLAVLLQAAVQHATAGAADKGAAGGKRGCGRAAAAAAEAAAAAQEEATLALMQALPELLRQYQADPHVVGGLPVHHVAPLSAS